MFNVKATVLLAVGIIAAIVMFLGSSVSATPVHTLDELLLRASVPHSNSITYPAGPVDATVKVRFVQGTGEEITREEHDRGLADVREAMEWWTSLSPITTTLRLVDEGVFTVNYDAVGLWQLLLCPDLDCYQPNEVTVFIVDNSSNGRDFLLDDGRTTSGLSGYRDETDRMGPVLVLTNGSAVVETHEFGHALYALPDLYYDDRPEVDIMDTLFMEAYLKRFIGWQSLHLMGVDPRQTYMPVVFQDAYPIP